tara:strand:- start:218 stop:319 length:102 start_codon:yes stop_codon:yes gene_type:complete
VNIIVIAVVSKNGFDLGEREAEIETEHEEYEEK